MSQLEVDKIIPQSGTTLTLGDTGDTINFGSGVLPNFENLTVTGDLTVDTNSLKVDSTNNRVGIGTSSPTQALDVVGNLTASGTGTFVNESRVQQFASQSDLIIQRAQGSSGSPTAVANGQTLGVLSFKGYTSAGVYRTGSSLTARVTQGVSGDELPTSLYFSTTANGANSPTERMRITDAGNVGIGTSSPGRKVTIYDSSSPYLALQNSTSGTTNSDGMIIGIGGSNAFIINYENQPLTFSTNGSERMRIDSSGNVGIGTSSPEGALNISRDNFNSSIQTVPTNYSLTFDSFGATGEYGNQIGLSNGTNILSSFGFVDEGSAGATGIYFTTGNSSSQTERLRISNNGNVGIGTSSPGSNRLLVEGGNVYIKDHLIIGTGDSSTISSDSSGNPLLFGINLVEKMRINSSGNVGIGTTSPTQKLDVSGTVKATAFQGDGSALTNLPGGGKVLQVVNVTKTDKFTTTTALPSFTDITGMSVSITPSAISSKILVLVNGVFSQGNGSYGTGMRMVRNGSAIYIGDSSGSSTRMLAGQGLGTGESYQVGAQILDSPSSTSSVTYKLQLGTESGGTAQIGGSYQTSGAYHSATASSITLMEIGA
jgi:hypothetical protein